MAVAYNDQAHMAKEPDWIEAHGRQMAVVSMCFLAGGDPEMGRLVASRFNALVMHARSLADANSVAIETGSDGSQTDDLDTSEPNTTADAKHKWTGRKVRSTET